MRVRLSGADGQTVFSSSTPCRAQLEITVGGAGKAGTVASSSLYIFSNEGGIATPGRTENARPWA